MALFSEVELEVQLSEAVAAGKVGQPPAVKGWTEGGLDHGPQAGAQCPGADRPRVPPQAVVYASEQFGVEVGGREVGAFEDLVDERAELETSPDRPEGQVGDGCGAGKNGICGIGRVVRLVPGPGVAECLVSGVELGIFGPAPDGTERPCLLYTSPVGLAAADGVGEGGDLRRLAEAVVVLEHDDVASNGSDAGPERHGPDDLAEHCPGFDTRQLRRVAHENERGLWSDGVEETGHEGKRHHGGLVDHDQVVGQAVGSVEPRRACHAHPEQAMQRLCLLYTSRCV